MHNHNLVNKGVIQEQENPNYWSRLNFCNLEFYDYYQFKNAASPINVLCWKARDWQNKLLFGHVTIPSNNVIFVASSILEVYHLFVS